MSGIPDCGQTLSWGHLFPITNCVKERGHRDPCWSPKPDQLPEGKYTTLSGEIREMS